jgi:beta-xylosidase
LYPEANKQGKLWLKMRNDEHVLSAWYSADGKEWHKYPWAFEISGAHHNILYGFLFVRPAIYAGGGEVEVTHFVLRNLDEMD